jgi:hypothetical protein
MPCNECWHPRLREACAFHGLPEIITFHLNHDTHLLKSRSYSLTDAIAERVLSNCRFRGILESAPWGEVRVIRSDNGGQFAVVATVQDGADCVTHPLRRFGSAKLIQYEYFSVEDGLKDA